MTSENQSTVTCDICNGEDVGHRFDLIKESGGQPVHTCEACTTVAKKLALVVKEEFCMWCWAPTNQKYEWVPYGQPGEPSHRICGDCRQQIAFTEKTLSGGALGSLITQANKPSESADGLTLENWPYPYELDGETVYDEYGNPIPSPLDECDFCGIPRHKRPDGFAPEIVTPYGEVEYLCRPCREQGRGMK